MSFIEKAQKAAIVQIVAGLHPRSGGPARTVVQLANSLARHAEFNTLLVSQKRFDEPIIAPNEIVVNHIVESSSNLALKLGFPLKRKLRQIVCDNRPGVIHNNGLWLPVNFWANRFARSLNIPFVIQPRGMLEPWAVNYRAWKKKSAMVLFQRRDLETAAALIATSSLEYENIRQLGFRKPIAVIPNGIELEALQELHPDRVVAHSNIRTLLFLSRVHPKKGLLNLVHAWSQVSPSGWQLCIAGPDEGGHLAEVIALAQQLGVAESVEYLGEVDGARKSAIYRDADLFVLPTFSENFGVVVAEALAHGLPVITTRGAPWADLETYRCGWWIDIGVDPLVQALREAMSLTDDERRAMGIRGREYVKRYDWDSIAQQTIEVYRWVLGQGPMPDCVRID